MKAKLSKNKKFILLDSKPKENIKNGIIVYFQNPPIIKLEEYLLPQITTDIIEDKTRYYLPRDYKFKIIRIELK